MTTVRAGVLVVPRQEFLERRWSYQPGQHVTGIGFTQCGKSTLMFELLGRSAVPTCPAVVLVSKPRDPTPTRWGRKLGFRRIKTWPPPPRAPWAEKPSGWMLWPQLGDMRKDPATLRTQFSAAMSESYSQAAGRRGQNRIIMADEIIGASKRLKLGDDFDQLWEQGSGMGIGLWAAAQRPFNAPQNAYEQSAHLFLWGSTDKRNRKRFTEIGGVDSELVDRTVSGLRAHEVLYIRRTDYTVCIIEA